MIIDNLNVLPFYASLEEQNHRKPEAFGQVYPLLCGRKRILPFQIARTTRVDALTVAKAVNFQTGEETNLLAQMGMRLERFEGDGYDLIINDSVVNFPTATLTQGQYYLVISDGVESWYSDIFTVVNDLTRYMKLEYFDKENVYYREGHIDYSTPYRNYLFINAQIGKPEYPFEEEAQKRDGYTFFEKQISQKKYRFEFPVPEYLCDALRIVRMHDKVRIYTGVKIFDVENIILEPKWQEQGDLAIMEVEFECNTVIKKVAAGITPTGLGDFNDDYNEDFHNI